MSLCQNTCKRYVACAATVADIPKCRNCERVITHTLQAPLIVATWRILMSQASGMAHKLDR